MERRRLFSWLSAIPLLALNLATGQESQKPQKLKIMMKSAWGSDDPTRRHFPFYTDLRWQRPATMCRFSCLARVPISCGRQPWKQ
jgi:hypothetical protein